MPRHSTKMLCQRREVNRYDLVTPGKRAARVHLWRGEQRGDGGVAVKRKVLYL